MKNYELRIMNYKTAFVKLRAFFVVLRVTKKIITRRRHEEPRRKSILKIMNYELRPLRNLCVPCGKTSRFNS
jgi:hypothetical protein